MFKVDDNEVIEVNGRANKIVINLSNQTKNDKSRNLTYMPNIGFRRKTIFLTSNAKKVFNYL